MEAKISYYETLSNEDQLEYLKENPMFAFRYMEYHETQIKLSSTQMGKMGLHLAYLISEGK